MSGKNAWLGLRLSQADKQRIEQRASLAGFSVSEYIRIKALSDYSGPAIVVDRQTLLELLVSLKRIGNNINQLI